MGRDRVDPNGSNNTLVTWVLCWSGNYLNTVVWRFGTSASSW